MSGDGPISYAELAARVEELREQVAAAIAKREEATDHGLIRAALNRIEAKLDQLLEAPKWQLMETE